MTVIPGLPSHLATIPPAPYSHTDPDADAKREAWMRWRYEIYLYRVQRHRDLIHDPGLIPFERQLCASHPAYWAAMWLRVFEPRWRVDPSIPIPDDDAADDDPDLETTGHKSLVLPDVPLIARQNLRERNTNEPGYDPAIAQMFGYVPFICFEKQVVAMNRMLWSLHQTDEHADIVWSKCRGWGASWIGCLLALWGWTFSGDWPGAPPWNVLMLSRKEELVDSKKQRSLFWKIRRLMRDMPDWQIPKGYNASEHNLNGFIYNPETGNELAGESTTTKAGRGDRVTWAWLDEAASMPEMLATWSTVAETTDHRWAVSTESFEEGPDFYELRTGNEQEERPFVIESDWWENPLNDDLWIERQRKRYAATPDAFQQEIWRNPKTGSTWVYPWANDIPVDPRIIPTSGWGSYVAIDPGYRDPCALVAIQESPTDEILILDSYQGDSKEADFFAPLLSPDLFSAVDPNWHLYSHLEWVSPFDATLRYTYDEREISFARTVAKMGKPTFVGDTWGETLVGASKDSIYSRWRKYGIHVNRDRRVGDGMTPSVKQQRTHTGRQEAMNECSRRFRAAQTPGALTVVKALKEDKYKGNSGKAVQTEPKEPEHGWFSHIASAMEYYAVYVRHRKLIMGRAVTKSKRTGLGGKTNFGSQMRRFGNTSARQRFYGG